MSTVGVATDGPLGCGDGGKDTCASLFFWACPDPLHAPTQWVYRSRVDYTNEMAPSSGGPNEHDVTQLEDGRVLVVFRLDSNAGHFAALSSDNASSWHTPWLVEGRHHRSSKTESGRWWFIWFGRSLATRVQGQPAPTRPGACVRRSKGNQPDRRS